MSSKSNASASKPKPAPKPTAQPPKEDADNKASEDAPADPVRKALKAEDVLFAKMRRQAERDARKEMEDRERYVYVMRCPINREHHALYFTENPIGKVIDESMWFSLLHDIGDPYGRMTIPCQQCLMNGEGRNFNARLRPRRDEASGRVTFQVPDEHAKRSIFKIDKDEIYGHDELVTHSATDRLRAAGADFIPDDLEVEEPDTVEVGS